MRMLAFASVITVVLGLPISVKGVDRPGNDNALPADVVKSIAADETRSREVEFQLAPIKSRADLDYFLTSGKYKYSPLAKLSAVARKRFVTSLVFNEKGLVGYDYSDLRAELSASQIYGVLSLFGAQRTTPLIKGARVESEADKAIMKPRGDVNSQLFPDYNDYRCESRATCAYNQQTICMSGC